MRLVRERDLEGGNDSARVYPLEAYRQGMKIVPPIPGSGENEPGADGKPVHRSRDRWEKGAKRWMLVLGVQLLAGAALFMGGRLSALETKEQQRIAAAIEERPNKEQLRISERMSDVEGQLRLLVDWSKNQRTTNDKFADALGNLSNAMAALTAEFRAYRTSRQ